MEIFRYLKYSFVAILVLFPILALVITNGLNSPIGLQTKQVSADGDNCEDADYGSIEGDEDEVEYEVEEDEIITGVCIESGSNMFEGGHSGILDNGDYEEDDCYSVSGVGTNEIEVERNWDGPLCQGINHIDIYIELSESPETPGPDESEAPEPTDSPDPDESEDPSPTPTETPQESGSPTPTPTQEPTSTPTSTPTSSDGGNSSSVGGQTISNSQGQVLGLSATDGSYGLNELVSFLLGIILTGYGINLISQKTLSSKKA